MLFPIDKYPPPDRTRFPAKIIRRGASVRPGLATGEEHAAVVHDRVEKLDRHDRHEAEQPPEDAWVPERFAEFFREERRKAQRRAEKQPALVDTRVQSDGRRLSDHQSVDLKV